MHLLKATTSFETIVIIQFECFLNDYAAHNRRHLYLYETMNRIFKCISFVIAIISIHNQNVFGTPPTNCYQQTESNSGKCKKHTHIRVRFEMLGFSILSTETIIFLLSLRNIRKTS